MNDQLIDLIAKGYKNLEIANELKKSISWVEKQKYWLRDDYEARTDAELIFKYYYNYAPTNPKPNSLRSVSLFKETRL